MGLIKSGMKWGAIAYVANQGIKAVGEKKQSQQQQALPREQSPPPYPVYGQQGQQFKDGSGYLHQR